MTLFDKTRQAIAQSNIAKRLFGYGKEDEYFGGIISTMGTDRKTYSKLDAYEGVVYACVNLIAETIGSYQPILYRQNGDQEEAIKNHPLLELLNHPGGVDNSAVPLSRFDLFEATGGFNELQGECYWYMQLGKVSRKPKGIVLLRADKVGVDIDKDTGNINGYFIRRNIGSPIPLSVDEVLPFKYFNPKDPYHGFSPTDAGSDYINTDILSTKFTKNFFKNNAGLSGILELKGEITEGAFKKFVRMWRSKYEGVDSAGKTAIIRASEANFTKVGLGLDELDMSALRKMSRDDIAMLFRVPMPLLGKAEESGLGRGNVEALEYIFAKYNIEPKLKRIDAVLQFALQRYYGETNIRVGHMNIIPADKEFELRERDLGVDRWLKRNEVRDTEGLDPVDGGDQLFIPFTQAPIGDISSMGNPATDKTFKPIVIKRVKTVVEHELKVEQKEMFRSRLQRNQTQYERQYKKVLKPLFADQKRETLNNLEALASSLKKDFNQKLFDDAAADALMTEELMPVLRELTKNQGALALVFAGDEESEFALTANMEDFLKRGTKRMATNFNDETIARLNRTLGEGVTNGENIQQLRKRVDEVYTNIERTRSLRIARTETLKASNNATNWAYKQTGYVTGKQWYVNPGGCPECSQFEGKTVGLDDSYLEVGESYSFTNENGEEQTKINSYDTVESPPLHPNCRCTIIPVR